MVDMVISIDGPAASGKSTTAKIVAERLGLLYIDTGAMYRAVALYFQQHDIDITDFLAIENQLDKISLSFKVIGGENRIFLNGQDVSGEIRTPEITKMSSEVATKKVVRKRMVELQRALAENQNVILDGRDIGSIVFPNADFKFFLTATLESRASRRHKELVEKGVEADLDDIKQDLIWRDQNDSQRAESPLKVPDGAIQLNTTEMTITGQVDFILKKIARSFD